MEISGAIVVEVIVSLLAVVVVSFAAAVGMSVVGAGVGRHPRTVWSHV